MALPGDDPRHRHQPCLRVHHPGSTRRPAARHPARPRTQPLRAHPTRTPGIPGFAACADSRRPGVARADRRAGRRPEPRRRRTLRYRDPAPQPGQRRPPGRPARDLDRRNPRRPPRPLPRARRGRAAARAPRRALPPGPLAVPHPARRRTRRTGPRRRHPHRHHLARPGRIPRHRRRPRRPHPPPRRPAASPAARPLDQPHPRADRPRPAGLPHRNRGPDGRPHPPTRPAHRPDRPRLGHHRHGPGPRRPSRPPATGNARPP